MFWLLFCVVLLLVTNGTYFSIRNNRIIDSYGRESYFHGVNVVYKSPPWLPILDHFDYKLSFSEEDMELLNSLGQNIIRLGVMWPGVAPNKNSYNYTYINKAKNLIETAYDKYGIHTLVDCHQDVISAQTCGEGAPTWAVEPRQWNFPFPLGRPYDVDNETHIPSREDCLSKSWASYYATEAASSIFQRIYSNYNGLADAFADYWATLAAEYKNTNGIVGFELMNEPWSGGIYEDPFLMYPGVADRKNLQPFYDLIAPKIYANDPNRMIFFESVTWTDEFNVSLTETGFDHVPGGLQYSNQSVFAFHYYSSPNIGSEDKYFYERTHDAIRWNCGSMVTEFSIGNDGESQSSFDSMSTTMDYCDKFLISWIGWEYKPLAGATPNGTCTGCGNGLFLNNGTLNIAVAKAISRTYPQFVAGETQLIYFNYTNGYFRLIYNLDTLINEATVIYTNLDYWYINGYDLTIDPSDAITSQNTSSAGDLLYLYSNNVAYNGKSVTVTISTKEV